jgi:hypothetical protein
MNRVNGFQQAQARQQARARRRLLPTHAAPALLAFVLSAAALAPTEVLAASEISERVALGAFRGPQATRVRDAVENALLRRYYLVPESMVAEAARKSGVRLKSDQDFAAVGKTLNVKVFVSATVRRQKNWRVEMVVRKGETGQPVGRFDWSDRRIDSLAASLARSTPKRLRALMSDQVVVAEATGAAATVSASPEPVSETSVADEENVIAESTPQPARPTQPYMELGVGGRVFNRSLSYTDNVSGLPGYHLDRAMAISLDMALHPFAAASSTAGSGWAGIGLTGAINYALGVDTSIDGTVGRSRTEVHGYEVGLRHRIAWGIAELMPHAGYMVDTFVANASATSPDVSYRSVRAGLGARLALSSRIMIRASADYLHVLSAGPLNGDNRFPRATVRGVDLTMGVGYTFVDSLEAQLQVGLRRYGIDMKARPDDQLIVGGAVDQYLSMTMGVTYRPTLGGRR